MTTYSPKEFAEIRSLDGHGMFASHVGVVARLAYERSESLVGSAFQPHPYHQGCCCYLTLNRSQERWHCGDYFVVQHTVKSGVCAEAAATDVAGVSGVSGVAGWRSRDHQKTVVSKENVDVTVAVTVAVTVTAAAAAAAAACAE